MSEYTFTDDGEIAHVLKDGGQMTAEEIARELAAVPVVPEPLADILRQMVKLHQEKGTVLTVHMNEVAILLDQFNAAPESDQ